MEKGTSRKFAREGAPHLFFAFAERPPTASPQKAAHVVLGNPPFFWAVAKRVFSFPGSLLSRIGFLRVILQGTFFFRWGKDVGRGGGGTSSWLGMGGRANQGGLGGNRRT